MESTKKISYPLLQSQQHKSTAVNFVAYKSRIFASISISLHSFLLLFFANLLCFQRQALSKILQSIMVYIKGRCFLLKTIFLQPKGTSFLPKSIILRLKGICYFPKSILLQPKGICILSKSIMEQIKSIFAKHQPLSNPYQSFSILN